MQASSAEQKPNVEQQPINKDMLPFNYTHTLIEEDNLDPNSKMICKYYYGITFNDLVIPNSLEALYRDPLYKPEIIEIAMVNFVDDDDDENNYVIQYLTNDDNVDNKIRGRGFGELKPTMFKGKLMFKYVHYWSVEE